MNSSEYKNHKCADCDYNCISTNRLMAHCAIVHQNVIPSWIDKAKEKQEISKVSL